ncbi:MAG: hypothetical protein D6830_07890 [Ignavibacteria bacterium]|nr:MAG: hypothetical protein D6830_07890 [Ignavibacteria bacterium]
MPGMDFLSKIQNRFYRFFQFFDTSTGIYVSSGELTVIQIRKRIKTYQVLQSFSLPYENKGDLFKNILSTIEMHKIKSNYYTINPFEKGVLIKKVKIPIEAADDILSYLLEQPNIFLPPGLNVHQIQIYNKPISADENHLYSLVIIARESTVHNFCSVLNTLTPLQIVHPGTALDNIVSIYIPDFSGILMVINEKEIFALLYYRGKLMDIEIINRVMYSEARIVDLLHQKTMSTLAGTSEPHASIHYLMAGNDLDTQKFGNGLQNKGFIPLNIPELPNSPNSLSAFALGLTPFINVYEELDLQPPAIKLNATQQRFKHLSIKSILILGLCIIILAVFLYGIQFILNWQYSRYETQLERILPLIERRDSLSITADFLQASWKRNLSLTRQRSNIAFYLYQLSKVLPENMWFNKIRIETSDESKTLIQLHGLATTASDVTRYLENIEKWPFAKNVLLEEMNMYSGKEVYRKWKLPYQRITEFRIRFYVHD